MPGRQASAAPCALVAGTRPSPQVLGITPRFLRSGFNGLGRALADDEFVLPPSPEIN